MAPPYSIVDNAESLLGVSDLVFLDPVSTGYSRAIKGGKPGPYHGYQGDVESVAELIRLWTSRHGRWMSPKLLAGESYGTLRAAALAEHLQNRYGMYLNGLILISSVLDLSSIDFENQRNDRAHANYLPTYAAVAHYHGKLGRRSLDSVLAEAQEYAGRDYLWALSRGSRLTPAERSASGAHAGRAHRSLRGLRRPGRPAHRALALLRRAAARPSAGWSGGSTAGSPDRRTARSPR